MQWSIVIHNSNTDLGSNINFNLLIFKVIAIVIYYIDFGSNNNSNSIKVIVIIIIILHCNVIDPMSGVLYLDRHMTYNKFYIIIVTEIMNHVNGHHQKGKSSLSVMYM